MLNRNHLKFALRLHLLVAFTAGLLVLWSFLREPSEPGSAVFLGFSYLRLILISVVLFLLAAILGVVFGVLGSSRRAHAFEAFLIRLARQKGTAGVLVLWMFLSYLFLFLSENNLGTWASYRERLFPIALWLTLVLVQFSVVILSLKGVNPAAIRKYRGIFSSSLMMLILYALLLLMIAVTRIGLTPDQVYWQAPGAPILLYQVLIAGVAGGLLYSFLEHVHLPRSILADLVLFLGLWALASIVWLNEPADYTWFSLEPTPPNYQSYPFSDALLYDGVAREYLIGKPIPSDFWAKPVYSLFLAMLHLFVGGNYAFLVSLQVLFLALIPAFAYLFATRLDARPAGLVLALLLILREQNALALSNVIQVSHVKLLLSDVFAMGFMVVLLWLFFHWFEKPGERRAVPLVLGGVLSLLVLTRGHPLVLLPLILGVVCFVPVPRPQRRWEAVLLTFAGFLIPFLPWLWRNYELTGKLALRHSVSIHSGPYSLVYSAEPRGFGPGSLPPRLPGESDAVYYNRLQAQAMQFILEHPDAVAKFTSAHYFHNLIASYAYLPYEFEIENVKEYVREQAFWGSWTGNLSVQGFALLVVHLAVIAIGMGYLWKKYKYFALVPLILGIGYNLSISIARVSGWRFILPADWITLVYYAVGLMQLYELLRGFFHRDAEVALRKHERPNSLQPLKRGPLVGSAILFLSIGLLLTRGQELFSQRYPVKSILELKESYLTLTRSMPSALGNEHLETLLRSDGAVIVYGQALHPSFLAADEEGFDSSWPVYYFWPNYRPQPFSRLIFTVNGPTSAGVVLPMDAPPSRFPDGADVIVVGCRTETGEIDALAVLLQNPSPVHYSSEPFSMPACPLTIDE